MQNHVELENKGFMIRGMLHLPERDRCKVPGVVIFHGYTGNKMEPHFILVKLSRALEKLGIASARFDFYGSGESEGTFQDMTPDSELRDAKTILDYMRSLDAIDKNRIGLCGLSMGGYIAGITAGDYRDYVKALCLLAPAGNIKEIFESDMAEENKIGEGLFDVDGLILNAKARESAAKIDHIKRTSMFDKKVCIIHGDKDESVPYSVVQNYRNALKNSEFHNIEGADHTFNSAKWEDEVIKIVTRFFKRELLIY